MFRTVEMCGNGSFWKTCWNLGDVDLCLAFRFLPACMHDLPTSSHLQGMLLLFFVIVFPSSLYLSALQILGLSDIRFVTL